LSGLGVAGVSHRRIDEIPGSGTAHKTEAVIVEEGDITIPVAAKDHALVVHPYPAPRSLLSLPY
jgi:hypothetical protein